MREYAEINPRLRTLDSLYELLVESEIIPRQITERCNVEFTLTSRNLQIVLSAKTSDDEEFCNDQSTRIAELVDNPNELVKFAPDAFQFATAAVTAPVTAPVTSFSGATKLVGLSSVFIFIVSLTIME